MWDLPGPGLKPTSPALAGGFSTTTPPGKPLSINFRETHTHQASLRGVTTCDVVSASFDIIVLFLRRDSVYSFLKMTYPGLNVILEIEPEFTLDHRFSLVGGILSVSVSHLLALWSHSDPTGMQAF